LLPHRAGGLIWARRIFVVAAIGTPSQRIKPKPRTRSSSRTGNLPRAVRCAPGAAEKKDVSPARALATDRPLRERPLRDRNQRERSPNARPQQPAGGRTQQEIDALVTAHLPLASFAVNAVAARISLPGHVSRDDLLSCAHVALVEVAKRFDPSAGASFATYALARLQGAVLDELRSGD
jgi:hypothetical protein